MKVVVYTSDRSVSLRRVASDVVWVLRESGVEVPRLVLGPDVSPELYQGADGAVVVMTFDTVWAMPYFSLAWILQSDGLVVRFYTTIEGYPRRRLGDEWVYRDLSFIANSKYTASRLAAVGARVTDIVYHGIRVEDVAGAAFLGRVAREKMGFDRDDFVVGYIAGAYPRKGHNIFAKVVAEVGKRDPSVKFVVLTQPQAAEHYAGLQNCTVFTDFGKLDEAEVYAFYHAVDLYAQPSLSEGFGLPVLEALAAGKPVVHADYMPLSEITTPETSFRVPVRSVFVDTKSPYGGIDYEIHLYDPAEFAEAILQAKDEVLRRRGELARACRERAELFHAKKTYARLADLLR